MNRIVKSVNIITILLLAVFLVSCAFGTRHPTLTYPPESDSGGTSVAQAAVNPTPKNIQIVLIPFTDERTDKRLVGTVRNAYGMRTADVIPTNSVEDWVTQAVRTELHNKGYNVFIGTSSNKDSLTSTSAVVSGEILNVFCDMYMSYTGQVSLYAKAKKGEKEILNKHYKGEGSAGLALGMTSESYAKSLALALSSALEKFVAELDSTLAEEM